MHDYHWKPYKFLIKPLLCFLCGLGLILSINLFPLPVFSAALPPTPLSTVGNRIVDAQGRAILLRGVNWFGLETDTRSPHGLWARDYKSMLKQIKDLGYNVIRLPFSIEGLRASTFSAVNFGIGSNSDLQGKTPLQVMDLVIQEAQRQGLYILLDNHRLNQHRIPELWYGDGFSEQDWISTWTMLADRYRNQSNVIGADLKNEPHGNASWGTGNMATDWRLAAERCGNAILATNPNWLIVVEGVEKNVPGQQLTHWWGGNLEGVRHYPVRLNVPNKLVYSPHEYGQGVHNQPWFHDPSFPNNMPNRWQIGFQYIADSNIAPILVGEFGGRQVDATSKEGIWQRTFVKYIGGKNLHFTYWSWNPNSSDTGGILQDNWQTVHADKQQLLSTLLGGSAPLPNPIPTPTPSPTPSPAPTPTPSPTPAPPPPTGSSNLSVRSMIDSDWQTGFCARFMVTNQGNQVSEPWRLGFQMNQASIQNSWNGTFQRQGSQYTVTPAAWGQRMQPNQTVDIGFCANKQGTDYRPSQSQVLTP